MTTATPKQLEYLDDLLAFQMTRAKQLDDVEYREFVLRISIPKSLTKEQASELIEEFKSLTLNDLFNFYRGLLTGKYTIDEREARERNAYENSDYWKAGMFTFNSREAAFKILVDVLLPETQPEPAKSHAQKVADEFRAQQEDMYGEYGAEQDIRTATSEVVLEYNDYRRVASLKPRRESYRHFIRCARLEQRAIEGDQQSVEYLKSPVYAFEAFYESEER